MSANIHQAEQFRSVNFIVCKPHLQKEKKNQKEEKKEGRHGEREEGGRERGRDGEKDEGNGGTVKNRSYANTRIKMCQIN